MAATIDETIITELKRRLKKPKGSEPQKEHVAVAVLLARDLALTPSMVWSSAGVPPGGARTRIIEYRDCIANERLLDTVSATAQYASSVPPGLSEQLLVRQLWIDEHAPHLHAVNIGQLILSVDAGHATREIFARISGHEEMLRTGACAVASRAQEPRVASPVATLTYTRIVRSQKSCTTSHPSVPIATREAIVRTGAMMRASVREVRVRARVMCHFQIAEMYRQHCATVPY
jgi:hypothetical protein